METLMLAASFIRTKDTRSQVAQRELELAYSPPRALNADLFRLGAAVGGVVVYAGLLALAWQ